jgi:hypothetical protein
LPRSSNPNSATVNGSPRNAVLPNTATHMSAPTLGRGRRNTRVPISHAISSVTQIASQANPMPAPTPASMCSDAMLKNAMKGMSTQSTSHIRRRARPTAPAR